jgi:hypothetical protein
LLDDNKPGGITSLDDYQLPGVHEPHPRLLPGSGRQSAAAAGP